MNRNTVSACPKLVAVALIITALSACKEAQLQTEIVGTGNLVITPLGTECGVGCYQYATDTVVTIEIDADSTSKFKFWTGDCNDSNSSCELVMDANKSIIANFSTPMAWGSGQWDQTDWQ